MTPTTCRSPFILTLLTVITILLWPAGCNDSPPADEPTVSPQTVIDLLWQSVSLAERNSDDSAAALLQQARLALEHCKTCSLADSVSVFHLLSSYYSERANFDETQRYNTIAVHAMWRSQNLADSLCAEVLLWQVALGDMDSVATAIRMARRALETERSRHPRNILSIARRISVLANLENYVADIDGSLQSCIQLIALSDSLPADEQSIVIDARELVGEIYYGRGEYIKAESLFTQQLAACTQLYGLNHNFTADAMRQIASVMIATGRQYESIDLLRRSIAIYESLPAEQRVRLPFAYHTLAIVCGGFGLDAAEEEFYRREATLDSIYFGANSVPLCFPMMGLAHLKRTQGKFDEARSLYDTLLNRLQTVWQIEDASTAEVYFGIGLLQLATHHPKEAENSLQRYRDISIRYGRLNASRNATSQSCLAIAAALQGRYDEAIERIHDAEDRVNLRAATSYHSLIDVLCDAAEIFRAARQYDSSLTYFNRLLSLKHQFMERSFPYLTESQRLQWLSSSPLVYSSLISLALRVNKPDHIRSAFEMAINAKGRTIEAGLAERHIALCSNDLQIKPLLDEYLRISSKLANLTYLQMTQPDPREGGNTLDLLVERRDSLELALSQACFDSGSLPRPARAAASEISAQLRHGELFWDFLRFCPTDSLLSSLCKHCPCDDHYAVFVCDDTGVITLHDAGRAAEIDSLVLALRSAIAEGGEYVYSQLASAHETKLRSIAAQLTRRFPPLPPRDSVTPGTLYVSPDGLLGFLPFELLTPDSNRYLIDDYRIIYVASARDLVIDSPAPSGPEQAIILAAPAYDSASNPSPVLIAGLDTASAYRPVTDALAGCFGGGFISLPQSALEASSVARLLSLHHVTTTVRTGRNATESFMRSLAVGPGILHVATHGFFCAQVDSTDLTTLRSPLLRSGLALAGANLTLRGSVPVGQDDGILTAYEVSAMNLTGTDLVILSACETGIGDVSRSEGLMGLTRAFRQAGARTVIMNIWDVPDDVARDITTEFYRRWTNGAAKVDALREASLAAKSRLKERFGHTDPFLWCGFILAGNPR